MHEGVHLYSLASIYAAFESMTKMYEIFKPEYEEKNRLKLESVNKIEKKRVIYDIPAESLYNGVKNFINEDLKQLILKLQVFLRLNNVLSEETIRDFISAIIDKRTQDRKYEKIYKDFSQFTFTFMNQIKFPELCPLNRPNSKSIDAVYENLANYILNIYPQV